MKKYIAVAFVFATLFGSVAARADVTLHETDGIYNQDGFTGTIANGTTGSADTIDFNMAASNFSMTIDLTDVGGIVLDTIFSPSGQPGPNPNDAFEFAGINSGNAAIGTTCVASGSVACVVRTAGAQDLTAIVGSLNGGDAIFGGGNLNVRADDTAVAAIPEPSSLMLLGTGIAGAFSMARRRFARAA